jgi:Na+/H+-dicarboxylate symporter
LLGFDPQAQALMIALYIAMDSFGTACNVTGDGALAVIINKLRLHPHQINESLEK